MVDRVSPDGFVDLASWLQELVKSYPSKAAFARAVGAKGQHLTKWLKGGKPTDAYLKKIADETRVDFRQLKLWTQGMGIEAEPASMKLSTKTEMGAIVGRKWEELREQNKGAAMSILTVIETLVTLQRDSYRAYAQRQQEITRKRKSEA